MDAADEPWAIETLTADAARGSGDGRLRNLQGLFNLNNLLASAETMQPAEVEAATREDLPPAADAAANDGGGRPAAGLIGADANARPAAAGGNAGATAGSSRAPVSRPHAGQTGAPGDTLAAAAGQALPAITAAASATNPNGTPTVTRWQVAVARFSLLLAALDIDDAVVPAILDWLDEDGDTRFPGGAEDDYYMGLERPYRAANQSFADISELRLVRGITAEIYTQLAPFVTALPRPVDINVNLAPLEVLMAIGPGIDRGTAEVLDAARVVQPFQSVAEFMASPMLVGRPLLASGLATESSWFA